MKRFAILAALVLSGTASFAGLVPPPMEPPVEMSSSSDSDMTGALVLLALVGMVVASSSLTGRAKAEKDPFLLDEEADN
ncbi:MAG: hypothetical protein AAFN63_05895 [Pseudomonadota bacterium]